MESSSSLVAIRRVTVKDAELISRFGAATFSQTFAAMNSPEDMAAYLASAFRPDLQAAELQRPDALFLIASIGDAPVGYAHLDVTEPPECVAAGSPGDFVELMRFYVDAAWHGQGVSRVLMREVLGRAAGRGHGRMWLGVWEKNGRAISFYKKWGFEAVGSKEFLLGSDLQTDLVMIRDLG